MAFILFLAIILGLVVTFSFSIRRFAAGKGKNGEPLNERERLNFRISSIVSSSLVLFMVWTFLWLAFTMGGNKHTNSYLFAWAIAGGIIVFNVAAWAFANKICRWLGLAALGLFAAAFTAMELYFNYDDRIPSVTQETEWYDYKPFLSNNKLAKLPEPATLRIAGKTPKLDGATALYPLYAAFVESVYDTSKFTCHVSTTPEAYSDLFEGRSDIIFCAAPSKEQRNEAEKRNIELELTPIGKEAFVFFVNAKNTISRLDVEQIRAIYSGKILNWREVGGKDESIRLFQRPEGSGSQTAFLRVMGDTPPLPPKMDDKRRMMGAIVREAADYKNYGNSIGYSFLYFCTSMVASNDIKLLAVNGVFPSKETIRDGSYPLSAPFYAITRGKPKGNAKAFIEWILSPQGQFLVEKTGYVAIAPSDLEKRGPVKE